MAKTLCKIRMPIQPLLTLLLAFLLALANSAHGWELEKKGQFNFELKHIEEKIVYVYREFEKGKDKANKVEPMAGFFALFATCSHAAGLFKFEILMPANEFIENNFIRADGKTSLIMYPNNGEPVKISIYSASRNNNFIVFKSDGLTDEEIYESTKDGKLFPIEQLELLDSYKRFWDKLRKVEGSALLSLEKAEAGDRRELVFNIIVDGANIPEFFERCGPVLPSRRDY